MIERKGLPVRKVTAEVPASLSAAHDADQERKLRQAIGEIPADAEGVDMLDGVSIEAAASDEENNDETFTPTAAGNSNETGMSAGA